MTDPNDVLDAAREAFWNVVIEHYGTEGQLTDSEQDAFNLATGAAVEQWLPEEPNYEHDCKRCVFLGVYRGEDIYWCSQGTNWPTIIFRRSSEPSDYESGYILIDQLPSAMRLTAQKLTKERRTA